MQQLKEVKESVLGGKRKHMADKRAAKASGSSGLFGDQMGIPPKPNITAFLKGSIIGAGNMT